MNSIRYYIWTRGLFVCHQPRAEVRQRSREAKKITVLIPQSIIDLCIQETGRFITIHQMSFSPSSINKPIRCAGSAIRCSAPAWNHALVSFLFSCLYFWFLLGESGALCKLVSILHFWWRRLCVYCKSDNVRTNARIGVLVSSKNRLICFSLRHNFKERGLFLKWSIVTHVVL